MLVALVFELHPMKREGGLITRLGQWAAAAESSLCA